MWNYIWPMALAVGSNLCYHVCAKSTPERTPALLTLTLSYLTAAAATGMLYLLSGTGKGLASDVRTLNWTAPALGLAIVGLEFGFISAYRAGWAVSAGAVVSGVLVSVALVFIGAAIYGEPLSWNRLLGVALCGAGIFFLNWQPKM